MADKKLGKGKDKIDDEDITFQRMVAKVSAFCLILCIFYLLIVSDFLFLLIVLG